MFKKLLKSKQFLALLVLLIVAGIGVTYFIFRPRTPDKQIKGVEDRIGTTVEYKEGRITKKIFGGLGREDVYRTNFLPNLVIRDKSDKSWEVVENILNDKEGIFNANIIFKSGDMNLVLNIINNNKTLENGKTCFVQDDISQLNETWTREKMIDVSGQQTGYLFMKNSSYIPPQNPEFDNYYKDYVIYQKQLSQTSKEKEIITNCSTASRMNFIDYVGNDGILKKGLIRVFYNKTNSDQNTLDMNRIDGFIKETIF